MTTFEVFYLCMAIGAAVAFAVTLAVHDIRHRDTRH